MCGRYALYGPVSRLRERFDLDAIADFAPRYNIAPTQFAPVIGRERGGPRTLTLAKWGLIPSWVKDPATLNRPINAKAETVATKPMFRHAFRHRRVLVPARGFYEWQQRAGHKQPWFIGMADGDLFGFGGLLETWRGPEGELATFALITTPPNERCATIHDRMPLIVAPQDHADWLDPTFAGAAALLKPYPAEEMRAYRVGMAVNRAANEGPGLVEPLAE